MRELIKIIFEKDIKYDKFIKAINNKSDAFDDVYFIFRQLTDMRYDSNLKFPYEVIDDIRRVFSSIPLWLITDDSIKTQKKYRIIDTLYNKPEYLVIFEYFLKRHGYNIKPLTPFPEEYGLDWLQRNDGLTKARETANKYVWEKQGVLISQSDYKWWSMMKFNQQYAPQIRKALDKLNLKYELVLP